MNNMNYEYDSNENQKDNPDSNQNAETDRYARVNLRREEGSGPVLNIRSGPGYNYEVVGTVDDGERLELIESKDGWVYIRGNGIEGWCNIDVAGFFR